MKVITGIQRIKRPVIKDGLERASEDVLQVKYAELKSIALFNFTYVETDWQDVEVGE